MFWLLIVIFFGADGQKNVQTKIEPTELACTQDASKYAKDLTSAHSKELLGLGLKCDGPLNDPSIRKEQT